MAEVEMKDHQIALRDHQLELLDCRLADLEAQLVNVQENRWKYAFGIYSTTRLFLKEEEKCRRLRSKYRL